MDYRLEDVVLLSITNSVLLFGLNLFHCPKPHDPIAVQNTVSMILNIFEKVYGVDRNTMARIINYLQALIYLFIHNPDLTVLDIPDVLDPSKESEMLRLRLVQNLPRSPAYNYTRYFWTKYYNQRGYFGRDEELAGIFNKFREMTSVLLWPVFCQKNTIDFSTLMAQKKIVLCKLNSDWPDMTSLVGSILIGQILHAGYVRRHTDPFYAYCDEFQNFATYDFARLFAEARKFNIAMTIAHQTETQVEVNIREVCKQAGNLIVFRVTAKDSSELATNFDNTPPPGRIIYERIMEEKTLSEPMEWWEDEAKEQEYNAITYQYKNTIKALKKYDSYTFKESDTIALTCMRKGEYLHANPNDRYSYSYQKVGYPARYTFGQLRPLLPLLTDQFYSDASKLSDRIKGVFCDNSAA